MTSSECSKCCGRSSPVRRDARAVTVDRPSTGDGVRIVMPGGSGLGDSETSYIRSRKIRRDILSPECAGRYTWLTLGQR